MERPPGRRELSTAKLRLNADDFLGRGLVAGRRPRGRRAVFGSLVPAAAATGRQEHQRRSENEYLAHIFIIDAYGYEATRRVLRGRGAKELLPRCRAAGGHPARGQPPGPLAREATWDEAARPVGPQRRADGGRAASLPPRTADPLARGASAAGRPGRFGRRAARRARARGFDRPGRNGRPAPARRVP